MPSEREILAGLAEIANDAVWVSIGWHVVVGIALIAVIAGFRPTRRFAALFLSAPLASVGVLAFAFGNPFNGAFFAALAVTLAVFALLAPSGGAGLGRRWSVVLGGVLLTFGWTYPHFLEGSSAFAYLYAAPLGAIPCPTLSMVIGAALIAGGFGLGAWRLILASAGSFFALFGALRLGVLIDAVLLVGAMGLFAQYLQDRARQRTAFAVAPAQKSARHQPAG